MEQISKSAEATKKFATKFAKKLKGGEILCLYGELGSGKTTFVQGLAEGLGIKKRILSPTFILIRSYPIESQTTNHKPPATNQFHHVDLYRIDKPEDIEMLGLQEILGKSQNIVAIEWAEKIKEIVPSKRIDVHFEHVNENTRRIRLSRAFI